VGKEKIVLDLSCRKRDGKYYVVTNRWQTFTNVVVDGELLNELAKHCDEFLVHGVDVEGKASGIEVELVELLAKWNQIPITYAGGIGSMENLQEFKKASIGRLDFTIGSALDLFGGSIPYEIIKNL
jgi:phosphoribosylformimino-5-aminoimidazole carboxamide ribotide isomerase